MSANVIAFPERIYRPDVAMVADVMATLDGVPPLLVVEKMASVARGAIVETPQNMQTIINSLAVAYLTLARSFGDLNLDPEGKPIAS